MSVRLNLILSDELNAQIELVVEKRESTKAEVLRKAIALYLAASDGKERGLKLGLVNADQPLVTEIVGV